MKEGEQPVSLVRRIRPGVTWLITRRTVQRQFLLRPDPNVKQAILYALAYALKEYRVEIHAFQCLSNHYHMIVSDPYEELPDFMHRFDNLASRLLNLYWKRRGSLFENERYSAVELADEETIIDKVIYVLTNTVTAGLIHRHEKWPGATSTASRFGDETLCIERPDPFFARSTLPEEISIRFTFPPCFRGRETAIRELVVSLVREREKEIRENLRREGRGFLGKRAVLKRDPTSTPDSVEECGARIPEVACKDPERRKEALSLLQEFREAYRIARARFVEGARDVLFPHGTWFLRVRFGAQCLPAPVS